MAKMKPKKGVAGKNTGRSARAAIRAARNRGATTADIARAARRSESTILKIESGEISNPPANLDDNVRKAKGRKNKR